MVMFLNKTHIHEHVPGLISWNVGHEGTKGKAQCNLPGGAGYRSKERVTEIVTAAESLLFPEDGQIFPWAPSYARKATWKRQNISKTFQSAADCSSQWKRSPLFGPVCQLSGMSRCSKGLLGKGGRSLHGIPLDIHFLTDDFNMENNETILITTTCIQKFCVFKK